MNKIYSEPIEKAQTLIEGLKQNREFLATQGYDLSLIDSLQYDVTEMLREAQLIAEEEERVAQHRSKCHGILERLKSDLLRGKLGIKNRFSPEEWNQYGVTDKR